MYYICKYGENPGNQQPNMSGGYSVVPGTFCGRNFIKLLAHV